MKELIYYTIDGSLGWNQDWFVDWWMNIGGCAAVTACDLCVLLARDHGLSSLYPHDPTQVTRVDYLALSEVMKPYLRPRKGGVDRLVYYLEGFGAFLQDRGVNAISLQGLDGEAPWQDAWALVQQQVDRDLAVPCLVLYHKDPVFRDFQWHWFNLAGYRLRKGRPEVRAVTYGAAHWLDMERLWETGHERKGGLIKLDWVRTPY